MKAKEAFGWTLYLLFVVGVLVVSTAVGPGVYKRLQGLANGETPQQVVTEPKTVQQSPVITEPKVEEVLSEYDIQNEKCKLIKTTFGSMGTFSAVYDANHKGCVIDVNDENSRLTQGITLAQFKIDGGKIEFPMPFNGFINNSAEFISVNGIIFTPGNPILSPSGKSSISQGDVIAIDCAPGNLSCGPMLFATP